MSGDFAGINKRESLRIAKNITLNYYPKGVPGHKVDVSHVKDISKGGVKFTASSRLDNGSEVILELMIPYLAPKKTIVDAVVVGVTETALDKVYEIRAKFINIDGETRHALNLLEEYNRKGV